MPYIHSTHKTPKMLILVTWTFSMSWLYRRILLWSHSHSCMCHIVVALTDAIQLKWQNNDIIGALFLSIQVSLYLSLLACVSKAVHFLSFDVKPERKNCLFQYVPCSFWINSFTQDVHLFLLYETAIEIRLNHLTRTTCTSICRKNRPLKRYCVCDFLEIFYLFSPFVFPLLLNVLMPRSMNLLIHSDTFTQISSCCCCHCFFAALRGGCHRIAPRLSVVTNASVGFCCCCCLPLSKFYNFYIPNTFGMKRIYSSKQHGRK